MLSCFFEESEKNKTTRGGMVRRCVCVVVCRVQAVFAMGGMLLEYQFALFYQVLFGFLKEIVVAQAFHGDLGFVRLEHLMHFSI